MATGVGTGCRGGFAASFAGVSFDTTKTGFTPRLRFWGHSSAGRAPAWHAGGQEFESPWLHWILTKWTNPVGDKTWRKTVTAVIVLRQITNQRRP